MAPEFGNPIHHLPLIPAQVLRKHRVHEAFDTRFTCIWAGRAHAVATLGR